MRLRPPRLALAALLLLPAAGCGLTGGALVTGRVPTGEVVVENRSRVALNVVLLSRCRSSTYGLNRLGRGEAIPTGAARAFTVDAGCWDVGAGSTAVSGEAYERFDIAAGGRQIYTITD